MTLRWNEALVLCLFAFHYFDEVDFRSTASAIKIEDITLNQPPKSAFDDALRRVFILYAPIYDHLLQHKILLDCMRVYSPHKSEEKLCADDTARRKLQLNNKHFYFVFSLDNIPETPVRWTNT